MRIWNTGRQNLPSGRKCARLLIRFLEVLGATGHPDDLSVRHHFPPELEKHEVGGSELDPGWTGSAVVEYVIVQYVVERGERYTEFFGGFGFGVDIFRLPGRLHVIRPFRGDATFVPVQGRR